MAAVNGAQLAAALNVTIRRVQQLVHEGMPQLGKNRYELGQCFHWYVRYLQQALEKRAIPIGPDGEVHNLGDARVRSIKADAEMKELELAKARGQLVTIEDVDKALSEMVLTAKTNLMALPSRLTPELLGETNRNAMEAKIDHAVREALSQLAGKLARGERGAS